MAVPPTAWELITSAQPVVSNLALPSVSIVRDPPTGIVSLTVARVPLPVSQTGNAFPSSFQKFKVKAAGTLSRGDALAVARIAGILAAKKTSEIVPLAHTVGLDAVSVECELEAKSREVVVTATASTAARTGVEMEALTAVAGACLAIYDMAKALDRSIEIREIVLLEKTGGRSGPYRRG